MAGCLGVGRFASAVHIDMRNSTAPISAQRKASGVNSCSWCNHALRIVRGKLPNIVIDSVIL